MSTVQERGRASGGPPYELGRWIVTASETHPLHYMERMTSPQVERLAGLTNLALLPVAPRRHMARTSHWGRTPSLPANSAAGQPASWLP